MQTTIGNGRDETDGLEHWPLHVSGIRKEGEGRGKDQKGWCQIATLSSAAIRWATWSTRDKIVKLHVRFSTVVSTRHVLVNGTLVQVR